MILCLKRIKSSAFHIKLEFSGRNTTITFKLRFFSGRIMLSPLFYPPFDFLTFRHNFGVNHQHFQRGEGERVFWQIVSFPTFHHTSSERRAESLGERGQASIKGGKEGQRKETSLREKSSKNLSRRESFWRTNWGQFPRSTYILL